MIRVKFSTVPAGSQFYDFWGEWCLKTSDTGAVSSWCAPGFEMRFGPDEIVGVEK